MSRDETTCINDSQIPIKFDSSKMFCYHPGFEYVPLIQCESRSSKAKCSHFKSIKDYRDEMLKEGVENDSVFMV